MNLAELMGSWHKTADSSEWFLRNCAGTALGSQDLTPGTPEAQPLVDKFSAVGSQMAADPSTLSFNKIFQTPQELDAAKQGMAEGVGDKIKSTMGGAFYKQQSERPDIDSLVSKLAFEFGDLKVLGGSTDISNDSLANSIKPQILDGARKALGDGDPNKIRNTIKGMVTGNNPMPAPSAGTLSDKFAAPIASQISSSISTAVRQNENSPALPRYLDQFQSFFKSSSEAMIPELGQAAAKPFTPSCPAIKGFADQFTSQITNPGYNAGMNTYATAPLQTISKLLSGDFGGALSSAMSGLGFDTEPAPAGK